MSYERSGKIRFCFIDQDGAYQDNHDRQFEFAVEEFDISESDADIDDFADSSNVNNNINTAIIDNHAGLIDNDAISDFLNELFNIRERGADIEDVDDASIVNDIINPAISDDHAGLSENGADIENVADSSDVNDNINTAISDDQAGLSENDADMENVADSSDVNDIVNAAISDDHDGLSENDADISDSDVDTREDNDTAQLPGVNELFDGTMKKEDTPICVPEHFNTAIDDVKNYVKSPEFGKVKNDSSEYANKRDNENNKRTPKKVKMKNVRFAENIKTDNENTSLFNTSQCKDGNNPIKTEEKNLEKNHKGLYLCIYCKYSSNYRDKLVRHERIHTGEKPFGCPHCDYRCRMKHHLKVHKCNQSHATKSHNTGKHDIYMQNIARLDRMNQSLLEATKGEFTKHTSDTVNPPLDTNVPSNSSSFSNHSLITNAE